MKKRVSYLIILFVALISVMQGMAQSTQPDVVCMGTTKNYYVDATPGSSYIWKIDGRSPEASTTNSVDINWTTSGIYTLTVQEITKDNCLGPVQSLKVTVNELPTATIGGTTITCQNAAYPAVTFAGAGGTAPYTFTYNINGDTNKTVTTNTGDTVMVSVPTSISGTFAYNLVEVTDSKSFTNAQTGTATIVINSQTYSTTKRVVCPLQLPFIWNDISCSGDGIYTKTLVNSNGCDSIASLELIVQSPLISTTEMTLCSSELPYEWNGHQYTTSGIHQANLRTAVGCDSVATLKLTVNTPTTAMKSASFCEGESYPYNGKLYSAPGSYDIPLQSVNGCDSIVTLVLKQNKGSYTSQALRLFSGETYSINGNTYSEAGVYTDIMKVADKCADVVVTDLSFINIPNTLTPNGDGKNDLFMAGYHVQIFNRNGILLYDGMDGWDGKYNNKTVSRDTYFYVLYYNSESSIKSKEGYIMVIP